MSIFSENLKAFRRESGLKQGEIAELVGVTSSTWSNYEVGKSEPNIESIVKISTELGVSIDSLLKADVSLIAKQLIKKKRENASLNASLSVSLNDSSRVKEPLIEYGTIASQIIGESKKEAISTRLETALIEVQACFDELLQSNQDMDARLTRLEGKDQLYFKKAKLNEPK